MVYCYTINDRMESFHEVIDEIVPHNHYDGNTSTSIDQNSGCVNDVGSNVCEREGQPIKIYEYDGISRCIQCNDAFKWERSNTIDEYLKDFYNSSSRIYHFDIGNKSIHFIPSYHVINSKDDIWFNYHSNSKIYSKIDLTDNPLIVYLSTQVVPKIKYLHNDGALEDSGQSYFH